jgi:hypothetical protein
VGSAQAGDQEVQAVLGIEEPSEERQRGKKAQMAVVVSMKAIKTNEKK